MDYQYFPTIQVGSSVELTRGYSDIIAQVQRETRRRQQKLITIETYPGTDEEALLQQLIQPLQPALVIHSEAIFCEKAAFEKEVFPNLTEDRVFGRMRSGQLTDFIDPEAHASVVQKIRQATESANLVVIYGVGASLVVPPELLLYADLPRWEIQQRIRKGNFANWRCSAGALEEEQAIKRCYYLDWPLADRLKKRVLPQSDYLINLFSAEPVLISTVDYLQGLSEVVKQPFSLVPFFDPGVWGGHWMQEQFHYPQPVVNLAWSFNGVPEENSLLLAWGEAVFETPGNNLVFFFGEALLGVKPYGRFGDSFPIRFNFLDTVGGQNLSLQVHPKVSYMQEQFQLPYTQDESYYILHAEEGAKVYLGLQKGVTKEALMTALEQGTSGENFFDADRYIYQRPVQAHDHYLIPAGTVHSSGAGAVVLEISATPNRFTFKMWDWGRVDLTGKPRPVHLDHAAANIDWRRDETFVSKELCNVFEVIASGEGWQEERTGLHAAEWIETRRHTFSVATIHENTDGVNVINLVSGAEVTIDSPDGEFAPFLVHFAQTVIIPGAIKRYRITPSGASQGQQCMTMKAFIR